ncbi:reverse transcriptase domain-containing protein [Tanacetum coccineum]
MQTEIRVLQQQRQDDGDRWTRSIRRILDLERARELEHQDGPVDADSASGTIARTRQYVTNPTPNNQGGVNQTELYQLVTQRVVDALAAMEANRSSTQGDTNTTTTTIHTCSYKDFRSCMQGNFSITEGVVRLTRWFDKLELVFQVSKVEDGDNVKYAACTMLDGVLTWWNSYVRTLGIDATNAIPWSEFKQMLIKKYCPRSEVQKMETELWNLKVKGTNIVAYTQRFQ